MVFIFCLSFDYINQPECLQKRHFALHDEKSVAKKCALNIVSVQPIILDLILPVSVLRLSITLLLFRFLLLLLGDDSVCDELVVLGCCIKYS